MASQSLIALLRALHRGESTLSLRSFDAAQIQSCIARGLGPLLFLASKDNGENGDARTLLRGADLSARVLIGQLTDAMTEILDALQDLEVLPVLLKGISICEEYYPQPHCRSMGDVDFLVPPSAYAQVEERLLRLGYERRSHRAGDWSDHHHGAPLFHPASGVWVEIHTGLFPPSAWVSTDPAFAVSTIMAETRHSMFFGRPAQRLSPELQLIYTASHWAYDLTRYQDRQGAVVALADIIFLLGRAEGRLDWERVLRWSRDALAGSYLYLVLSYLSRRELITIPSEVLRKLGVGQSVLTPPALALLHRFMDRHLIAQLPYGVVMSERSVIIVWQTLLQPGGSWRNLGRVPWNLLFPPGEGRFRLQDRWQAMRSKISRHTESNSSR